MKRLALALAALVVTEGGAKAQTPNLPLPVAALQEAGGRVVHPAHVQAAALRFGLSPDLLRAVIAAESDGRPGAVSSAGARGLMQLMPGTWTMLRARLGLGEDPFDPADNILAGAAYLRELHDRYGAPGYLAAYNAGPGRYEASLAGRPLPAETRAYVARITEVLEGGQVAGRPLEPTSPDRANRPRLTGLFATTWPMALGRPASAGEHRKGGLFAPRRGPLR